MNDNEYDDQPNLGLAERPPTDEHGEIVEFRPQPNQLTPQQAKVNAIADLTLSAYAKASTLILSDDERKRLMADFPDEAFRDGAGGKAGLIYIEHAALRDRFFEVLGPGQWAVIPRNRWTEDFKTSKNEPGVRVYVEAMLVVRGSFVSEAVGDMSYFPGNAQTNLGDAVEGAKTAAFRRCAKEFGVGLQAWKKEWVEGWWRRKKAGGQQQRPAGNPPPARQQSAPANNPPPKTNVAPPATQQGRRGTIGKNTLGKLKFILTSFGSKWSDPDLSRWAQPILGKGLPVGMEELNEPEAVLLIRELDALVLSRSEQASPEVVADIEMAFKNMNRSWDSPKTKTWAESVIFRPVAATETLSQLRHHEALAIRTELENLLRNMNAKEPGHRNV